MTAAHRREPWRYPDPPRPPEPWQPVPQPLHPALWGDDALDRSRYALPQPDWSWLDRLNEDD